MWDKDKFSEDDSLGGGVAKLDDLINGISSVSLSRFIISEKEILKKISISAGGEVVVGLTAISFGGGETDDDQADEVRVRPNTFHTPFISLNFLISSNLLKLSILLH